MKMYYLARADKHGSDAYPVYETEVLSYAIANCNIEAQDYKFKENEKSVTFDVMGDDLKIYYKATKYNR